MRPRYLIHAALVALGSMATPVSAEYSHDPSQSVQPADSSDLLRPIALNDGAGGCFVAFSQGVTSDYATYLQRLDARGNPQWGPSGIKLSDHLSYAKFLVDDMAGGVIVAWTGQYGDEHDVFAQRVDAAGNLLWGAEPVVVAAGQNPVLAVGNSGALRSTDGGLSWNLIGGAMFFGAAFEFPTAVSIVGASFICDSDDLAIGWNCNSSAYLTAVAYGAYRAFAVGASGVVQTGVGQSWTQAQDLLGGVHAYGVDAVDANAAIAVGEAGSIFGTSDGGTTWVSLPSGTTERLHDVVYQDLSTAVAVGNQGTIRRTVDAGNSWASVSAPTTGNLYGVDMAADGWGIAVGDPGIVLVTTDGGTTWTLVDSGSNQELHEVALVGDQAAVAVGSAGTLLRSSDRGATWVPQDSGLTVDLWGVDAAATTYQNLAGAVSDGAGGAVLVWTDWRHQGEDLLAQRLDANGNTVWAQPAAISTLPYRKTVGIPVATGNGGVLVAWHHQDRVWARHVDPQGTPVGAGAIPLRTSFGSLTDPPLTVADGVGGAIVAWLDQLGGHKIYAAKVSANGSLPWTANGVEMDNDDALPRYPSSMVPDDTGGAYILWTQYDGSFSDANAIVRGISSSGVPWGNPVSIAASPTVEEINPRAVSDGENGFIVFWQDDRLGPGLFAQRISQYGGRRWYPDVHVAAGLSGAALGYTHTVASDGEGGFVGFWHDYQNSSYSVYAQNLDRWGYLGFPEPEVTSVADVAGDQGGFLSVTWNASYVDASPENVVEEYSVWRRQAQSAASAVEASPQRSGQGTAPRGVSPAFFAAQSGAGWEFHGIVPASYQTQYSTVVPSYGDGFGETQPVTEIQVVTNTDDPFQFWASTIAGGTSVDNLAPDAPEALMAEELGAIVQLTWTDGPNNIEDLSYYNIYRGMSPLFPVDASSRLGTAPARSYLDTAPPGGDLYYRVTAVDIHENESPASNLSTISIVTPVETQTHPTTLALRHGGPNPFQGSTSIRFGLPSRSDVEFVLFDTAGRRVKTQAFHQLSPGWHSLAVDSTDRHGSSLASGVYFVRMRAAGERRSLKLVVSH